MGVRIRWVSAGCCWGVLLLLWAANAPAHQLGEGYVFLEIEPETIHGRIELTLTTLDSVLNLDDDGDGKVSDEEFSAGVEGATDYVFGRFGLGDLDTWYDVEPGPVTVEHYPLGRYAHFTFSIPSLATLPPEIRLEYQLVFDVDPKHRGLVLVERNALTGDVNSNETVSLVMSPDAPVQTLDLLNPPSTNIVAFIKHGIWHIWIGADHIAFLLTLLLQSVLLRQGARWTPTTSFRPALYNVARIVTLFTVAHTITLSLAALDIVSLPSQFVETVIAASILAAAILNFIPAFSGSLYYTIFVFGLFHGFGFASVLGHLTTQPGAMAPALIGFNVGVELGQLAIVLGCFPILYFIRNKRFYKPIVLQLGSSVIGVIALIWMVERLFDTRPLLGF